MIAHWNPLPIKIPLMPNSIITPVTHTVKSPPFAGSSKISYEDIELLEKKPEGFIGPRLPIMLMDEEFEALLKKILGDKLDWEGFLSTITDSDWYIHTCDQH